MRRVCVWRRWRWRWRRRCRRSHSKWYHTSLWCIRMGEISLHCVVCSTGEYRDYAGLLEHGRNYKRKSFILIPKLCSLSWNSISSSMCFVLFCSVFSRTEAPLRLRVAFDVCVCHLPYRAWRLDRFILYSFFFSNFCSNPICLCKWIVQCSSTGFIVWR